jgi:deazaflavin-dependent oxidoreductase (nitroreductase family)
MTESASSESASSESASSESDNFNEKTIKEFRANGGKVGGWFDGQTLLLVHHKGVKSGIERVTPLVYQQVGDSYAVFASYAGAPDDPQWFRNLVANPDTTAEIGAGTVKVRARVAGPGERGPIWSKQTSAMPNFAEYETSAAPREIPVVLLDPVA